MTERRYSDEEVARIFESASAPTTGREIARRDVDGLALRELQDIGREVGVDPQRIAAAATSLTAVPETSPRRRQLGMPVGVGRSIDLPRAPTDREWSLIVSELRSTFAARGRDLSAGETREWANGNLHALIEPTSDGWRMRLGTYRQDAVAMNVIGAILIVFLAVGILTGDNPTDRIELAVLAALGALGLFGWNRLRQSRWADLRESQMDHIMEYARALLSEPAPGP